MPSSRLLRALAGAVVTLASLSSPLSAQTDLDVFMKAVVARSDDNWKKLQQYILDERDEIALNGPGGARLWGEQRDFTWFLRDGYFVRSPVKFNGATIGEGDRRKSEDQYLRFVQRRDARGRQAGPENAPAGSGGVGAVARPDNNDSSDNTGVETATNVDGLIRQVRQPQFVSSSYFLRFKFDEGRYALAGREKFDGRDVLRVEYYPTRLYENDGGRRRGRRGQAPNEKTQREGTEIRRAMNKVALVTLWVEPSSHQIVKYTFDNVDFDFLPAPSILRLDSLTASMTMSQPIREVWLPKDIEIRGAVTLAIGQFEFKQTIAYHDYREANVASKVLIPR